MPLPDEEGLQKLKRIFDFLDDRDFTIDRPTWLSFCQNQNISTEALKAHKTQLLAQDPLATEEELHRKKLEQIFCCDPFDFHVASELRNLWYQKSEIQPEPFQQWAYGLSSHLLQLNTKNSAQTPIPAPPTSQSSPSLPSSSPVSQNQEWKKAVIMGGLIGSSILISTLLMRATIIGLSPKLTPTPLMPSPLVSSSPIIENQSTETPTPQLNSSTPLPEKSTPPPSPDPTVASVSPTSSSSLPINTPVPTSSPSTTSTMPSIPPKPSIAATITSSETVSISPKISPILNSHVSSQVDVEGAVSLVKNLYNILSTKQFNQADTFYSLNLQKQFNASFFNRFNQVTVEDLQVISKTGRAINLVGINTYTYPDGSVQKEKRSYRVEKINGEPKVTDSAFIKVLKIRSSKKASISLESPPISAENGVSQIKVEDAISLVEYLYSLLSEKQFDQANYLYSPSLQWQFKASFFNQFNRVRVENLRVTSMNNGSINLVGVNTYFYPDGSTQRERRSFTVRLIDGEPKLSASQFIKVLKPR